MFRGFTQFVCDDCGHKFTGPDMEWMCTVYPAPVKCPKCGGWHNISIRISCMSNTWWIVWLEQAYLPTHMEKQRRNCIRYIRGIHKISC